MSPIYHSGCISFFILNLDMTLSYFKEKTIISLLVCNGLAHGQMYSSTVRYMPILLSLFDINLRKSRSIFQLLREMEINTSVLFFFILKYGCCEKLIFGCFIKWIGLISQFVGFSSSVLSPALKKTRSVAILFFKEHLHFSISQTERCILLACTTLYYLYTGIHAIILLVKCRETNNYLINN